VVGVERVLAAEELDGPCARLVQRSAELGVETVDPGLVGVAQLPHRDQVALGLAQVGQQGDPAVGAARRQTAAGTDQRADLLGRLVHRRGGHGGELGDLLELVQYLLCGVRHVRQRAAQVAELAFTEPVEGVEGPLAGGDQRLEHRRGGRHLLDHARDREAVRDAPHQIGVADAFERAGAGRLRGRVQVGLVGRLPHLHGVYPRRLLGGRPEHHHRAVVEQGVAVARERGGDLLADHVVGQQQVEALGAGVEDVQHVLAVG
jgi:hypothetical protein